MNAPATPSVHDSDAILVEGLTKRYGERTVVDNVDLRVCHGEIVALLGPNGAGKSTTVEILEGYRTRTSGSVSVLGADPQHAGLAWRARLGIVTQQTGAAGVATVRELVRWTASLYPSPRDADEVIELVGLTEHARRRISTLSGGQQRRVDVATAIVGRPELLFLDEPTTGFDPAARHQFWELITGLRDEGTTILLTTHYLDEAAHLADRVVIIGAGRLLAEGSVDALGGPAAHVPTVSWRDADGRQRTHRTHQPTEFVAGLYASDGEVRDLSVATPTLESVYLGIIGRDGARPSTGAGPAMQDESTEAAR